MLVPDEEETSALSDKLDFMVRNEPECGDSAGEFVPGDMLGEGTFETEL